MDNDQIIISKELNNELRKITNNNTFRTKKIKIPEDKKLKTYEHVKYVYELIGKYKQILDWKTSDFKLMRVMITISIMAIIKEIN